MNHKMDHKDECYTAVSIESHELCCDLTEKDPEHNITYAFKPYSWWFCCEKMRGQMDKSVRWNSEQAYLYVFEETGYDGEGNEIKINACPFCGKPIVIEQTDRLNYWKKIVGERYGVKNEL